MSDNPDTPAPPGVNTPGKKPAPKSAAAGLMEKHNDKQKFDSADWAKELNKPKDKKG